MSGGVKKVAQVALGAVIGFVQGGPVGAVIGAGLAFYAAEQQEKLNTKSPLRDNEPSAQTVRSSKAPARFILGRVSTGGILVWAQEQTGDQANGEWLHLVYVLCEGGVDALEEIYLGEEVIASYGVDASYELVVNPTEVNAFLKENCPDWKDEQIGRGLSFVRLSLKYNPEKFPSGIPDARFIVRGRNDIYDPRIGQAVYTENTALHILWFLRTRCGVPDDEIVFETFASGANVCDEMVGNPDGTSSPRYRSSCVIGADEQRTNVLQKLEAACGGKTIRVGGRWMFQAGAYYGPYDFEITEDMVIGTITGSTEPTNDAAINTVRGTFIDPSQSWTETDYPEVSVVEWVVEDGGEAAETLSFSYVPYPYQAQRLANIELRKRRAGGTINVPMNFLGYNCRPGRAVRVNLPSLNILGEFIVTNWSMGSNEGCTASLQQYEAAQFDDAVGQPYNPIGFISLPSGGLGSPTNVTWTPDDTAEVTQGVLSWVQPAGIVSAYAVTIRQGGVAVQAQQVPETTLRLPIAGLPSGNYTMSVAALGPLTRSGEASITVNIDGPPVPEACAVQSTIDTITLFPSNTQHRLNGGTYEYFYSLDAQTPAAQAEYLGQGLSLTHTGLAFFTNYFYFIRSKNAYGVSGFLKVPASTSTDVTAMLDALEGKIEKGQLYQDLVEEIELISGPPSLPGSVNSRLKELGEQVAEAQGELQEQIDQIADLADSMPYVSTDTYALGQAVLGEDGKLYQASKAVPVNTPPPNTAYWTDIGQAVQTAAGLAARVTTVETKVTDQAGELTAQAKRIDGVQSSLAGKADVTTVNSITSRVTEAEGEITANGQAISGVQSSLTATNQNVTAAQKAATDAATLAGGKGKVIVQSAAPAVADRLAQNLWIDTTSNANTPKRWSGSVWVAVTDKVATDAAAAAASALTQVATKAEASAVTNLGNTVSQMGNDLMAQGRALTNVQASVSAIGGNGSNLIPSEYSWIASLALPTLANNSGMTLTGVAVPSALSGFGIDFVSTNTANTYFELAPSNNAAGWNISLEPGVYLVSYYASSPSAAAKVSVNLYGGGAGSWTAAQAVTATRTRYTHAITVTAAKFAGLVVYANQGATTGTAITFDSFMVERQIGASLTPSAFAAGPAARAAAANASATQAIDARVTQTETTLTSHGSAITNINNALPGKADNSAVQSLQGEVTQNGKDLASQATAVTQLKSTVGAIAGAGSNLLSDEYSWLTSTTLPVTGGALLNKAAVAVPESDSGYGYSLQATSNSLFSYIVLAPSNSQAGYNIGVEPGVYLVSMFVKGGAAGSMMANLYDGATSRTATLPYTTERTRITFPITITARGKVGLLIYPNRHAADTASMVVDSPMIEKRIGESNVPSPFVPGPSARAVSGQATAISQLDTQVKQVGTQVTAQATRLDGLFVQVNPEMEGDSTQLAGATGALVGVWTEQSARVEDGIATGRRVDGVQAEVGDVRSTVQTVSESVASLSSSTAQSIQTVQSSIASNIASTQQVSQTVATLDGKVNAQVTIKAQTIAGGRKVAAGLALGSDGETSEFLAFAQRFAVVDEVSGQIVAPLVVEGGQVFINTALINKLFVQEIVAAMSIKSSAVNAQGLPLLEINFATGAFTLRGEDADGSTLLNNRGLYVYDPNKIERGALGKLT